MRGSVVDPRQISSSAGAFVMATGIVAIALHEDGHRLLAELLVALAGAAWAALAGMVALELAFDPRHLRARAGDPASLTAVAGTAVLGSCLGVLGARGAEAALGVAAALAWPPLAVAV